MHNAKMKAGVALGLLLLALVAGLWLSGFTTLQLLGLKNPTRLTTYHEY